MFVFCKNSDFDLFCVRNCMLITLCKLMIVYYVKDINYVVKKSL